ncbi:MAG: hypothetical protein KKA29_07360, partial [Gammaproteobacteria bacterium]|nr:hypothetical protein [Gammaproteobacteria bacterium]MBU2022117.1 hypothetical protein [Gammaproteobacteria bacterium]
SEESAHTVELPELLPDLTPEDWLPLLLAAQSGDVQTTEEVFQVLRQSLPKNQQKALQAAINQFDLGLVETLIDKYQTENE